MNVIKLLNRDEARKARSLCEDLLILAGGVQSPADQVLAEGGATYAIVLRTRPEPAGAAEVSEALCGSIHAGVEKGLRASVNNERRRRARHVSQSSVRAWFAAGPYSWLRLYARSPFPPARPR